MCSDSGFAPVVVCLNPNGASAASREPPSPPHAESMADVHPVYYVVMTLVTLVVFFATVAGMVRRESSNERAGYAILSAVLFCCAVYMARQGGIITWFLSDPNGGQ